MDNTTFSFLKAVLGSDGATAMRRAVNRDPRLLHYLAPRTLLGWVVQKSQFDGVLPGVDNVYLNFEKSEHGYSGNIGVSQTPVVPFNASDEYSLVAHIASHIGLETGSFEGTDRMLVSVGRSVDALLKAKEATKALQKEALDLPGRTAQARKPQAPTGPAQPEMQPKMAAKPKLPKIPAFKMELGASKKVCKTCGGKMFKSEKFVGCMCWRDLAKHSATTVYSDGIVVEFNKAADPIALHALLREIHNS